MTPETGHKTSLPSCNICKEILLDLAIRQAGASKHIKNFSAAFLSHRETSPSFEAANLAGLARKSLLQECVKLLKLKDRAKTRPWPACLKTAGFGFEQWLIERQF